MFADDEEPNPVALHDFRQHNGSEPPVSLPGGPSLTRQEFAEECDINTIMEKYDAYLSDPMRSVREPMYHDFTQMPSTLMEAMDTLQRGREAFYSLPAVVRREFDNNAAMFVDFASDPANLDQMRTWGLAPPAKAVDASPATGPTPPAPPAAAVERPPLVSGSTPAT